MKSLIKKVVATALFLYGGTLLAQPAGSPPVDPSGPPASNPADPALPPNATAETLTLDEMRARIRIHVREAATGHQTILSLQTKARAEKDPTKLTCLNEKFLEFKQLVNIMENKKVEFEVIPEDPSGLSHRGVFVSVETAASAIKNVIAEALACIGEELEDTEAGDFDGPDIPDDPSDPIFPTFPENPEYGSPYN